MTAIPLSAGEMLDQEFPTVRAKLLEVAAALDRIARAKGSVDDDPRMTQTRQGLRLLADAKRDRAEQFQMIFSLPYNEQWREQYGITPPT